MSMSVQNFYRATRSRTRLCDETSKLSSSKSMGTTTPISAKKQLVCINNSSGKKRKLSLARVAPSPPAVVKSITKNSNKKPKLTPSSTRKKALDGMANAVFAKVTTTSPKRVQELEKTFKEYEVTSVYKVIKKKTGQIGGNAAGGAIYGEITQKSFQRVIDFLKETCDLKPDSLFLDIGSGLGKPNFHAAVDPCVEVSYGIELEPLRWRLSLHNLKSILEMDMYTKRSKGDSFAKPNRVIFTAGDITDAKTLDPFTHIYSFDVGFPPGVMDEIAHQFNNSLRAEYFISFHVPKKIIDLYEFDVENIGRVSTSMAGSSEGHTCYFYKRNLRESSMAKENVHVDNGTSRLSNGRRETLHHIDPLFRGGFDILQRGNDGVKNWIASFFGSENSGGARTRHQARKVKSTRLTAIASQKPLEAYYKVCS